ncbi:MAG TPA: hypothetical protein VMT56_02230 [Candidatus Bathyarchaeia archaeon]|nr:hypothetical protein [Candidatus Bathyarchaeia archaeon]
MALVWLAAMVQAGCTAKFIGDYDQSIDNGVSEVQQQAEVYFGKLKADPNTPYDPNFYNQINARMAALRTRAGILPQYPIIQKQIQELQGNLDRFQELDKITPRPVPIGVVTAAETAITVNVESILKLELALKRNTAPSLDEKNP